MRRRDFVRARANDRCEYCRATLAKVYFHVDHVVSLKLRGKDKVDNLAGACPDCNLNKAP